VAFNNHAGSTRSYDYVREHNEAMNRIDFIALAEEITAEPGAGEVITLPQPDGSLMRLRKLHADYDPTDRIVAMNQVMAHQARGEIVTGLLFVDPQASDLHHGLTPWRGRSIRWPRPICALARRRWPSSTPACAEPARNDCRRRDRALAASEAAIIDDFADSPMPLDQLIERAMMLAHRWRAWRRST